MENHLLFFRKISNRVLLPILILILFLGTGAIYAQPAFNISFSPTTIGPGNVSTLTFTIDNSGSGSVVDDLAFTDNLPAGVIIATPANTSISSVLGTLSAPDGGSTITYTDGSIGSGNVITITVDVTSSTIGTHANTTGDLTSSAGNSGTASANLTVSTDRPSFSMNFSPATLNLGERTTLTLTIDNSANANHIASIIFTDNLPSGMVIADPANISVSFVGGTPSNPPTIAALTGSSVISYSYYGINIPSLPAYAALAAGATCTISVDVIGNTVGSLINVVELSADGAAGKASAALLVETPPEIFIQKSFSTNPVAPGGTTNLEFTLTNYSRNFAATDIAFTDDLDAVLSGLEYTAGTPIIDICGTGSQISGTDVLTFTGGSIPAEGSVTFSVPVQVPSGATSGSYTNVTSAITATIDGSTVTGNTATEKLFISNAPTITKTFLDNPIVAGGTTTLEFTITNNSSTLAVTDITFTDNITTFLAGATIATLPADGSCGAGSSFSQSTDPDAPLTFEMINGAIAAGGSETFTMEILSPVSSHGTYTNTTSYLSATVDGATVLGEPASADLEVIAIPQLSMSFTDDPVLPGGTATLEFTVTYDDEASGDATNISFTDDLDAVISGLVATGLPDNDVCGTGSTLTGTSTLSLSGGNMSPGESFTFSVPVAVPASAIFGSYTNTTSELSAIVSGQSVTSPAASDDLEIAGLIFTKEFIDDPVIPGDVVTLRYTIDNQTSYDASGIVFTDNLDLVLSGLAAEAPLPSPPCGASALIGTTLLIYAGGTVTAGTICSFEVSVLVPASATFGAYQSASSSLSATMNGNTVTIDPATDVLEVNNNFISLSKSFTDDPVLPGSTVTLEYTLTNLDADNAISNITFSDDLDAALTGLVASVLPTTSCGSLSGTSTINFSGGSLAAGGTCTFSVTLQTPGSAPLGVPVVSTTSSLTGEINGFAVVGDPATDNLEFAALIASKAFASSVMPGESVTLTYTLTNPDQVNSVSNIRFSDDLDAFISGATASGLPLNDICGEGSSLSGTSFITFTGGLLTAGQTKTFDVTIQIPCTESDTYSSTTSEISADGNSGSFSIDPATANLIVFDDFTTGAIEITGETICYNGNPGEIGSTTAASGGDGSITYQWQSSSDAAFTSPTDISTDATTYTPSSLTATTWFRRQAKDATCNTTFTSSTGVWKVTVRPEFTAGEIETTGETICYNVNPSEIGSTTAASGGDGNITYQWQSSADAAFTSPTTISTNAATYDPSNLTTTTWFRRQAKDATCNATFASSTGIWKVTVDGEFTAGEIETTGETICYNGNPGEIGSTTAASGGDENITYQWQSSTDDAFTSPTSISTDAATYTPSSLTATTWFRRQAKDATCNTTFTSSTGVWNVTVSDEFTVGSISDDQMICDAGIPEELIGVAPIGGNTPYQYQWQISLNDQDFSDINGATDLNYQPEEINETTYFRLRQTSSSSCGEETTNSVEIHIHHLCCSEGTNECQGPNIGTNSAVISDVTSNQQVFDNYTGIVGAITHLEWWGSTIDENGDYCDASPKSFVISFYTDNEGSVGDLINSYEINVTGVPAGATLDNNIPIMVYNYQLLPLLSPPFVNGWISIQGDPGSSCEFTWVTSPNGDGISFIEGGNQKSQSTEDFAFGITFTPDVPLSDWGIYLGALLMALFLMIGVFRKPF